MFAKKTSRLIEDLEKQTYKEKKVLGIKYEKDTRYDTTDLCSHNMRTFSAVVCGPILSDLLPVMEKYDVIGIDEAQFFTDLYEVVVHLVEDCNIAVYIAALDGTFDRKPFGRVLDLIPMCDNVKKLSSVCFVKGCDQKAIYSHRKGKSNEIECIGGKDLYMAVCRHHYIKLNNL